MEALGFDLKYFLFQLTNFLVLFFLLRHLLHKPILNMLESRRAEIAQGIDNAKAAESALQTSELKQQEMLENARKEARELIQQTKTEAKGLEEELKQNASKKADELLEEAKSQIKAEQEKSKQELKSELSNMIVEISEKVLQQKAFNSEKQQLIRQQADQIKEL